MKKLMYIELGVLAVVLIVAIAVGSYLMSPAFSPEGLYAGNNHITGTIDLQPELVITWKTLPEDRQITAQQYFVYDYRRKDFLTISGQRDDRIYPAGVTKLFSTYIAMQYLLPDYEYTIGDAPDLVPPGSTVIGLKKGKTISAKQLVQAVLLTNSNDALYIMASEAGKVIADDPSLSTADAIDVFVAEMNAQAKKLSMVNTHFVNPDGRHDENHYTSFRDLAILSQVCMDDGSISQLATVSSGTTTISDERVRLKNTNALIDSKSPYYCPYAIGLTAGQIQDADNYVLGYFRKGRHFLLVGAFGCPTEADCFDDALQLFNQTISNY